MFPTRCVSARVRAWTCVGLTNAKNINAVAEFLIAIKDEAKSGVGQVGRTAVMNDGHYTSLC